jgi:hypothetical protein
MSKIDKVLTAIFVGSVLTIAAASLALAQDGAGGLSAIQGNATNSPVMSTVTSTYTNLGSVTNGSLGADVSTVATDPRGAFNPASHGGRK